MFLHVSVSHSVHRGGCYPSVYCRWYPSMPCRGGVLSQHALQVVSQHALQQEGVPAPGGYLLRGVWRPPSRKQTATVADGTHPTGMHSCWNDIHIK